MSPQPAEELLTIRDLLRYATTRFAASEIYYGHGTDNPWDEAVQLVMRSLSLPLENNTIFLDARLTFDERKLILGRIERRVEDRIPVAYLVSEAWFMGLPFKVDSRVLVPRSPIGELIQAEFQPWLGDGPVDRILDLCTGSGCIGIAAATVFDEAEVDLADISEDALDVARENIEMHGLGHRVRTVQSDVLDGIEGRYDLILSNPPYVDAEDLADMPEEYHHEPELGLAAGVDGLEIAYRILAQAKDHLTEQGLLVVEVGNSWVALQEARPDIPFTWIEFEHGGDGVFLLRRNDLESI
ncbi:50S ribosomal protein L3 N(5)-glutamine methyltransferase [Marinobacter nanhaiticus D15-8W]|uniref:Ribosomal protein uL3 glutamine methyltransferase n=1 Tax=Marinobacter nanhaiticus D15-8W TaxID=626887 RepID=N6VVP0_9GAMM|nr:50S ribosomal protein L3 N(5)-glutamine methyltransferase [Marinobacter nanhaiticus]ENO14230.1 50S ribosomal protein L3 N(5)-glutamine methyltransferase [Marinobacter nanhaiticus D15-8W]BES71617.1 50S ribosomal protein L3 N(5)-glutamine methyltransferase [Marinobacter nanhaiticus D15-8W]